MLVRYFPLFLLAVGKLSFLAKLLGEDPGFNYTKVGLASRHVHQDPDADQHEVSDAGEQQGSNAGQLEGSIAGRQEDYLRRHPRNVSIPRHPPPNPENTLAQRVDELVAKYEEVSKSIMPAVMKARQVIREDSEDLNLRDSFIPTVFFIGFLFDIVGTTTDEDLDLKKSLPTILWTLMAQGNYYILFSWPHLHTEYFGADVIPLPCSEENAYRVLKQMQEFRPENVGQLAVNVANAGVELDIALQCVLARGHKFAEAAEVGLIRNQLLHLYNEKLHLQVPAPTIFPDNSSLAHVDQALVKYRSNLPDMSGQSNYGAIEAISSKNHVIFEGLAFGGVALFATLMAQRKNQELVKRIGEEHLKHEEMWKRILRVISQLTGAGAATSAGFAYKALLAVGYENPSVIDCGADDMRRALALFPLLETPADILISAGNKRRAKQMVVDLGAAIRRNLHCLYFRPQAFALLANVNAYLDLLNIRIELS